MIVLALYWSNINEKIIFSFIYSKQRHLMSCVFATIKYTITKIQQDQVDSPHASLLLSEQSSLICQTSLLSVVGP